jgi:hypothetical protein
VGAHVARPVNNVAREAIDGRQAFEHLLVGWRMDRRTVWGGVTRLVNRNGAERDASGAP